MIKVVQKAWGTESWIVNEEYCAKILNIAPGFQCSLHAHNLKKETFHILRGQVELEWEGNRYGETLHPGDTRTILPCTYHRFSSVDGARILEVSTHHRDEDVVRITDSGKITDANSRGNS